MMKKIVVFMGLAFLALPFAAFAQSPSIPEKSIENLSVTDIADDSIVVLSQEDSGVPGYTHTKYAFNCLGELRLVDYYGSALDPNDKNVLQFERALCARQKMNDFDTSE
jgi:hypothetical protein